MIKFKTLIFGAAAAMVFAATAFGDIDPDVWQKAGGCGNSWCLAQFTGELDPNTGLQTLEDVLTSPVVVTGWDKVVGVGGSYWLLDFEQISGGTYNNDYAMFVYCFSTTSQCGPADAGVPASGYTLSATSVSNSSPQFQATTGIAGYTSTPAASCSSAAACSDYFIDIGTANSGPLRNGSVSAVPEPSSVLLFGSVLLIAGGAIRRRVRNRL